MITTRTMPCINTPTLALRATITAGHPLTHDFAEALTSTPVSIVEAVIA